MLSRLLVVVALLLAQRAAVAHALWHIDDAAPNEPAQHALCDFHDVLGTVVGAVDSPPVALSRPDAAWARTTFGDIEAADPRVLIRGSRGPPHHFPK